MSLAGRILARRMRLPRPQTLQVLCEHDLRAEMDDGTVLLADRWVARARADEAQPTVLVRSPYGRRQFVGLLLGRLLAERGLQVVVQSVRGTFGSGGEFRPFDERADGLATLRWLRTQPWHSGRVGTIGPSYLGFVQWAIAAEAQDLAAMSIHVSASQFHGQTYPGGSLSLENVASWMVVLAAQERRLAPVAINRALRALRSLIVDLPLSDLDERATGRLIPWYREAFASPGRDDPYWAARDFSATVPDVTAPVQFVGGWYDILLPINRRMRTIMPSRSDQHPKEQVMEEERTIEVSAEFAERFTRVAQAMASVTFDPDWELPERFSWALGYAISKLPHIKDEHIDDPDAVWSLPERADEDEVEQDEGEQQ